jgi:uncharacterized protein (DUF697 family)
VSLNAWHWLSSSSDSAQVIVPGAGTAAAAALAVTATAATGRMTQAHSSQSIAKVARSRKPEACTVC